MKVTTWLLHFLRYVIPRNWRPTAHAERLILRESSCRILSGPFKGMEYVSGSVGSMYYPKLLGSYELELHDTINRLSSKQFPLIVDIGAAEGYYAVGLSLLFPFTTIVAFEENMEGRRLLEELARKNNKLDTVRISGLCTIGSLKASLIPYSLVIMDIEGAELELLDPEKVPDLVTAEILVELHGSLLPDLPYQVCARFARTHALHKIMQRTRLVDDLPLRSRIFAPWLLRLANEYRSPGTHWCHMVPL